MTITRQLGIGYAIIAAACILTLAWLSYHEFVVEPAQFAARGLTGVHEDTTAEFFTVCFLGLVPLMLASGWWWTRRVLRPLRDLTLAAERIETATLHQPLPCGTRDDEIATLARVLADMTSRLDASFRQIREFTLHASHELKTPLTIMRAELETVRREEHQRGRPDPEWIVNLLDEVQRLARIVDSLTLLSKADAGLVTLRREPVALGDLVREAFEDALLLAQPQRVHVALGECIDARVLGDRHRLRQLLLILLDNAVKYNRPEGRLDLSLRERGEFAELRVANDGGSIPEHLQKNAFGRFVRGANVMGKVEGCGLGLNIAQWIVQAHGGTIALSSVGETTTATVQLPLAAAGSPERAEANTVIDRVTAAAR